MIRFLKFFFILFINIPVYAQSEYIYILGNTQDAGMPHIGCKHKFCLDNFNKYEEFYVTSIAVINSDLNKYILFEATPDITYQLNHITNNVFQEFLLPEAIYITHAHIGHYTGLMYFGREALGSKNLLVKVLPKMSNFLKTNGPWSQLITLNNIQFYQNPISPNYLNELVELIENKTISGKIAKDVFEIMFATSKSPKMIVKEKGLEQVTDDSAIEVFVDQVINENNDKVKEYLSGKDKLFGFFVGQVMKVSQGKANPGLVNKILKSKLK